MSTEVDIQVLKRKLTHFPSHDRVLYLGPRDKPSIKLVRDYFEDVETLDNDPKLRPTHCIDLHKLERLPSTYELIIAPYVLMYLFAPGAILRTLLKYSKAVLLQENVIRIRPDTDPWRDRNRFICKMAPRELRERATSQSFIDGKNLIQLGTAFDHLYYENDPGTSAIWDFRNEH